MKRISAIFFLFIFLGATELKELYRIPVLARHFLKHKKENGSMSFTAFFKLHYSKEKQNDNDDREDAQLPFKDIRTNTVSPVFNAEHSFITGIVIPGHTPRYAIGKPAKVPDNFGNALFHPPPVV